MLFSKVSSLVGLVGLVVLADLVMFDRFGGLGVVVFVAALGAVGLILPNDVTRERRNLAGLVLGLSLLPFAEQPQFLSFMFLIVGCCVFGTILATGKNGWLRAAALFPVAAIVANFNSAMSVPQKLQTRKTDRKFNLSGLWDWVMPAAVGMVFVTLFVMANPLVEAWLDRLARWNPQFDFDINMGRVVFWLALTAVVWPFMILPKLRKMLTRNPRQGPRPARTQGQLINDRSVRNALVMFNLIFVLQTFLDGAVLWGGVALPDGMSYAEYAHRGAYPLIVTALLAGIFAMIAQPYSHTRLMRWLLLGWVAQNILLVASSVLRLELYVGQYGLTYLRFAAFVWMGLVATGLALMIWQVVKGLPVRWLLKVNAGIAGAVLYALCFVNVAGVIARDQLARTDDHVWYICELGEGALPAIHDSGRDEYHEICLGSWNHGLRLFHPQDWREWGFRNARIRAYVNQSIQEAKG